MRQSRNQSYQRLHRFRRLNYSICVICKIFDKLTHTAQILRSNGIIRNQIDLTFYALRFTLYVHSTIRWQPITMRLNQIIHQRVNLIQV
jgi:hypothetical protein